MKLVPVSLALFYIWQAPILKVWVQTRTDDGIYHGLLEFPGGGIEPGESPLEAVIREVHEEVGITVSPEQALLMGTYTNELPGRTILLNVFLFPEVQGLVGRGEWLRIEQTKLSAPYEGKIPGPNHRIIDDLFHSLNG
jgi:8-oxo-dGTP diphosphatase